jgi:starch synthase
MSNSLNRPLRVLFLTSEYDPYAKVGGLGDYSGSLPKAIKKQSAEDHREVDIRLAIPFHGAFNRDF